MRRTIDIERLSAAEFVPFGDVIELRASPSFQINQGMCDRHHDLARLEFLGEAGAAGISLGHGRPYSLPLSLSMLERHPLGSQTFVPLGKRPFLVIVAPDDQGKPGRPRAFLSNGHQGVNYLRNTWHGVLTPLEQAQDFLIVDRLGGGDNLEEYFFDDPYLVGPQG